MPNLLLTPRIADKEEKAMPYYTTGYANEVVGTYISSICPPNGDMIPVLRGFKYRNGTTQHDIYVMSPLGTTTTIEFTASGGTTLELAKDDPGRSTNGVALSLTNNDWIAYRTRSGAVEARQITLSGTTATVAAVGEDVDVGATVWAFYDYTRHGNRKIQVAASATDLYENLHVQCGIPVQQGIDAPVSGIGMPLLVYSSNVSAAGEFDFVSYEWVDKSHDFIS